MTIRKILYPSVLFLILLTSQNVFAAGPFDNNPQPVANNSQQSRGITEEEKQEIISQLQRELQSMPNMQNNNNSEEETGNVLNNKEVRVFINGKELEFNSERNDYILLK